MPKHQDQTPRPAARASLPLPIHRFKQQTLVLKRRPAARAFANRAMLQPPRTKGPGLYARAVTRVNHLLRKDERDSPSAGRPLKWGGPSRSSRSGLKDFFAPPLQNEEAKHA